MEVAETIYMLDATYPGTKVADVGAVFIERLKTDPPPEYVKIHEGYAFAGGDGIRVLLFYEIDDAKVKDGIDHIARGIINTMKSIEGYKVLALPVYPLAEAFQIIDMQLPAV